ncbi:MAG TPA: family 78 glycoside hydrolase catalytic domain [Flavitalea sp.]|nr:family 78 glycoside hydrolase catalytic domain [Flavitalea sp.]
MPSFLRICFLLCFTGPSSIIFSQADGWPILQKQWKASWIQVPGEPSTEYGVYLFRKQFDISTVPSTYLLHISADNRYKLFVNDTLVSLGPARGDITHWNYETADIAPFLHDGRNIIAVIVWNEAQWRPEAQISYRTGLIIQGSTDAEKNINTDTSWKCTRDSSYRPLQVKIPNTYYVAGPGEVVNMPVHPHDWKKTDYNDASWKNAAIILPGNPKNIMGAFGIPVGWLLVPSSIPQMELTTQRLSKVRDSKGVTVPSSFPATRSSFIVPANTKATILLDQGYLTNAYPTITFSGGKAASVSLEYAETLYKNYPSKGNRNETEAKQFVGRKDSIISDGNSNQQYTPLNWRTYRYVQLSVVTREEPMMIDDLYGTFTGYPFKYNAVFEADDPELKPIMETGWRTARLCAFETYMDCPYYEQLQYIADARIQCMISLYNSGDDRLVKNAIRLIDQSRQPEGITYSRHPSYSPQFIPPFSLWYVGMLHDYWMYGSDTAFVKSKLSGARQVLEYFHSNQRSDGSVANVPYWMFTDWVNTSGWVDGAAPSGADSSSSVIDLQLLLAYQAAAEIEQRSGIKEYAALYKKYASQLKKTIRKKYWVATKGLYADRIEKDLYSQHANALAILTGILSGNEATSVAKKILSDTSLAPASIYFKYYLHSALIKAGLGNNYIKWLDAWRENLKMGLTTWAEDPDIDKTRSDCHAWGSSPNIELLRTVLGIDSDAPGFNKIRITPHLGALNNAKGAMPHPKGTIAVEYEKKNKKWFVNIEIPAQTSGALVWAGKSHQLKAGKNKFNF